MLWCQGCELVDSQIERNRVIIYVREFSLEKNLPAKLVFKVAKQLYIGADSLYIETSTRFWSQMVGFSINWKLDQRQKAKIWI